MMQDAEKVLQQIAFGHVVLPSGKMRGIYRYEMINLAREICDQLGIEYSAVLAIPMSLHGVLKLVKQDRRPEGREATV